MLAWLMNLGWAATDPPIRELCGYQFIEATYQATEDNQTAVFVEPTYEKWEVSING